MTRIRRTTDRKIAMHAEVVPSDAVIARRVLTDTQYLTWYMRSTGISQQAIAYYRGVSREAVRDCLARVDTKMKEAIGAVDS